MRSFVLALFLSLVSNVAHAEPPKFKIGFVLTMTGQWARFGEAQRNALELARKEAPERFENIEFIYEDCRYAGATTISAFHKLRQQDEVDMVFVWGVRPALALTPLADRYKLPLMVSGQLSKNETQQKYVIRTINYSEQYSAKLMEYLRSKKLKRVGIVQLELAFFNDRVNGLKALARDDESIEVLHELQPDHQDLNTIVSHVKTKELDILGLYISPGQVIKFLRASTAQQFFPKVFGSTPFRSRELLKAVDGRLEGAVFVHNDVDAGFQQRYHDAYGTDDQIPWAANAYDFGMLAGDLLGAAETKLSAEEILQIFSSFGQRNGAGGRFESRTIDGVGAFFDYAIVVNKIRDNDFQIVYR